MTRSEHLAWCKERALDYVEGGDLMQAFMSMQSDMRKHAETADHAGLNAGAMLMLAGTLAHAPAMTAYINSFR